jgi:leucyl-tRNA synthetase
VHKIGNDIERLKFNTALAELMSLSNWLRQVADTMTDEEWSSACRVAVLLLAPLEPLLAEELWSRLGHPPSVHEQSWPTYDPDALLADTVTLPVQVDGRMRATVEVDPAAEQAVVLELALRDPAVRQAMGESEAQRVVYVPGRVLNLVR